MMGDLSERDIDNIVDRIAVLNLERNNRPLVQNEMDDLEHILELHYCHPDSWSTETDVPCVTPSCTGEDCEQVKAKIAAAERADFILWLRRFNDSVVIGEEGSKSDCVMHRFFRQLTGVHWNCLEIVLHTATVWCEHTKEEVSLPPFAAQVADITTIPSVPSLSKGMPITAGWLREVLGDK